MYISALLQKIVEEKMMNQLIINADDFGLNESCTKAIVEAFDKKLITDTTVVANGAAFDLAVSLAEDAEIGENIGIHFNLTEGVPLTEKIRQCPMFVSDGVFIGKIDRLKRLSSFEKEAIYEELSAQICRIEASGIHITHADSHHHIHTAVFVAPIVVRVCKEHGVNKIRLHRNIGNISFVKRVVKKLYNQWLRNQGFIVTDYMGSLEDTYITDVDRLLEIMVHPNYDKDGLLIDQSDEKDGCPVGDDLTNLPKPGTYMRFAYRLM